MIKLSTIEARCCERTYFAAQCSCGRVAIADDGMTAWMPDPALAIAFATTLLLWSKTHGCRVCQKPVMVSIPWRIAEPRVAAALDENPDVTVCDFVEMVAREIAANDGSGFSDDLRSLDRDEEPFRMEAT